jgi:hypothetical protein
MLFDFNGTGNWRLWMINMHFDIDMAWLAKDGQIIYIKTNATPASYPETFGATKPSRYVIEVPAFTFNRLGVKEGDMLMFMNAMVLLAIITVVFGILPLLIGSNAIYILLTLCMGDLLSTLAAKDLTQIVGSAISIKGPIYNYVEIFLLVIAPLIVLVIFRKAIRTSGRLLQIIPAAAAAFICFMLVTTMLPVNMQNNIQSSNLYSLLKPYYEFVVAAGLLVSVLYLWTKRPHPGLNKKHRL